MKNLFKFNFLLSAVVAITMLSSFGDPPLPESGDVPRCPINGECFFPHSIYCNWFWWCKNGVAYLWPCPYDLCWNGAQDTCDYSWNSHPGKPCKKW